MGPPEAQDGLGFWPVRAAGGASVEDRFIAVMTGAFVCDSQSRVLTGRIRLGCGSAQRTGAGRDLAEAAAVIDPEGLKLSERNSRHGSAVPASKGNSSTAMPDI